MSLDSNLFLTVLKSFENMDEGEVANWAWRQHANLINRIFKDAAEQSLDAVERSTVCFLNEKYLTAIQPNTGVTFIRSAKNTGKTTSLELYLKQTKLSVLFVAHRISLVESLSPV